VPAQVRRRRPGRDVAVLHEVASFVDTGGAEVDCHHRLAAHAATPRHELVDTDLVALQGPPGQVEAPRALVPRADAVAPVVGRHEVAAGISQHRDVELAYQVGHVPAESGFVRCLVAGS
jgi:hypothetical protein